MYRNLITKLFFVSFLFLLNGQSFAQFYPVVHRPPGLNWQYLKTPHFKIIYPGGEDSLAYRTGRILEHEFSDVKSLVGGDLQDFPIVINNYNDRSNGFVTPLNFRMEFDLSPIKGKAMNPKTGNWLETVVPHELVHAMHFNHLDGWLAGIIHPFSPDAARSLHSAIPLGVHEGIATYHESTGIAANGGRGNYPYFNNQLNAVFQSRDRWSPGQMMAFPSFSRPFDRHYQGGVDFMEWLHMTYGENVTKNAIDFYIRWPFLGYGIALRHATGEWPGRLFERYEEAKIEEQRNGEKDNFQKIEPLPISLEGVEAQRPKWLSENKLIFWGSFYNARPGFYIYNLEDGSLQLVKETFTVNDYVYGLSADRSQLLFSNYRPNPLYDDAFKAELYETTIATGNTQRITTGKRIYAPAYQGTQITAVQSHHSSSRLVRLQKDSLVVLAEESQTEFVEVVPNPGESNQLAVIANKRGLQGIWIVNEQNLRSALKGVPAISFREGSIFDINWDYSGDRLLFTSDHTGTMQIYEYRLEDTSVTRLTDSPFNAMEASYGPGGSRIAFTVQKKNERLLSVLSRKHFVNEAVPKSHWKPSPEKRRHIHRPETGNSLSDTTQSWSTGRYSAGFSWLKPRSVVPLIEERTSIDKYELGIGLHSSDVLQRHAYSLEFTGLQERLWYDLDYRYTGFFPGFDASIFNRPSFPVFGFQIDPDSTIFRRLLRQEQGLSLSVPTEIILEQNSRFSSFFIEPELRYSSFDFFDLDNSSDPISTDSQLLIGNIFTVFNYKLQQSIRDLQPNSGVILFSELEHYLRSDQFIINTLDTEFNFQFTKPTALRTGIFGYLSPFRSWNQSLRIGFQALTQTDPVFDTQDIVSNGFTGSVLPGINNIGSISARYTIPLAYPDNGGFLVPWYLGNLYAVLFYNTVGDLDSPTVNRFFDSARTVIGGGIRTRFRLSNLAIDIGVAIGYEPSRSEYNVFIGNF